jgi:hypothetical protein
MAVYFVNELLCFLINKYHKFTKTQLKTVLLSFYSEIELSEAKDVLFNDAVKLNMSNTPRCIKRAKGGSRPRLLVDDILDLCTFLDENQAVSNMPTYVAQDLDRVPTAKPEDMDIFCLSRKVEELETRIVQQQEKLTSTDTLLDIVSKAGEMLDVIQHQPLSTADTSDAGSVQSSSTVIEGMLDESWSTVVKRRSNCQQPRRQMEQRQQPAIRFRGTKVEGNDQSGIKAVPRKPILAAFVGRLHLETKEEDLSKYLSAAGMKGVVCRRLKPKDGQSFKTAAFFVSCCTESSDLFYDETCWPEGVELRDWVFK